MAEGGGTMNRKKHLGGALLFLTAFGLALWGLNPSFYMDDSPEIATVAASLGIAHPPGYPLYTLLGRLLSLLPLGQPCLRVNLLSALCAATACLLLFHLLRDRFQTAASFAWPLALLWMAGATAYPAALSAKNGIYQLTAVFILAVFSALLRGRMAAAFFLFGLSLTNHWMSMVPCLAGFGYLAWCRYKERRVTVKEWLQSGTFLVIGLSLYLYLPLRSSLDPLVNWAHPVDLTNFLHHVSRYVDKNKDFASDPLLWARQGFFYLQSAFLELSGLLLLALLGAFALWNQNRRAALALLLSWAGLFAAVCVFSKFSSGRIYLMQNYSIASFILIPLFAAPGFSYLSGLWNNRFHFFKRAPLLATWVLVLGLVFFRCQAGSQAFYTYTYDYVLNAWRDLPKGAFFFCKGDVLDFPSWYLQMAEDKRPDIVVLGGGSLPMDWYRIYLSKTHPDLKVPYPFHEKGKEYISGHIFQWMVEQNPGHRLFFTYPDLAPDLLNQLQLVPNGLTQEGFPPPAQPSLDGARAEEIWKDMRLRHFQKPDDSVDDVSWNYFLKDYGMARMWAANWYRLEVRKWLDSSTHNGLYNPKILGPLMQKALLHDLWAETWDSQNRLAALEVGLDYLQLQDGRKALEWFEKAIALDPNRSDGYILAGQAAAEVGDTAKARDFYQKASGIDPQNPYLIDLLHRLSNPQPSTSR